MADTALIAAEEFSDPGEPIISWQDGRPVTNPRHCREVEPGVWESLDGSILISIEPDLESPEIDGEGR